MELKLHILIFFLLFGIISVSAQNIDPHGSVDSHITGMPSEKILMILDITVHDSLQYQTYRLKVEPLIEKFGGIYLVRSGGMAFDPDPNRKVTPVEGSWNPNRFIILEWESIEQLQNFTFDAATNVLTLDLENGGSVNVNLTDLQDTLADTNTTNDRIYFLCCSSIASKCNLPRQHYSSIPNTSIQLHHGVC